MAGAVGKKGSGKKAKAKLSAREEKAREKRLKDNRRGIQTTLAGAVAPVRAQCAADWRDQSRAISGVERMRRGKLLAPHRAEILEAGRVAPLARALLVGDLLAPIQRELADQRMEQRLAAEASCRQRIGTVAAPYFQKIEGVDRDLALFGKGAKSKAPSRASAAERRQQDDAAILRELEVSRPDLIPLWERAGKKITGPTWHNRWEKFLEMAEEDPEAVAAARSRAARQGLEQLLQERASAEAQEQARRAALPPSVLPSSSRRGDAWEPRSAVPGSFLSDVLGPGSRVPSARPSVSAPSFALAPPSTRAPATRRPATQRGAGPSYEEAVRGGLPNWQTNDPRQQSMMGAPPSVSAVPPPPAFVPPPRMTRTDMPGSPTSDQIGLWGPVQHRLEDLFRRAPS